VVVVNIGSYLLSLASCLLTIALTMGRSRMYDVQINGGVALLTGYLVAYKQLIPEHMVTVARVIKIRVKELANIFITINIVTYVFFGTQSSFLLSQNGLLVSWIYLRFFKWQDSIRGDRSETFAFVTFFPEIVHPIVKPITDTIYNILVRLSICRPIPPYSTMYDLESSSRPPAPLPGSARAEAERRRALALKALDMRLHAKPGGGAGAASPKAATFQKSEPDAPVQEATVLFDAEEAIGGALDGIAEAGVGNTEEKELA